MKSRETSIDTITPVIELTQADVTFYTSEISDTEQPGFFESAV